ncbi:MAG: penicillin-binding protein [Sphingobacteriaceae bacterium]|nr:penicillin-binding protein [Sphingobacteriaceae bacterium]
MFREIKNKFIRYSSIFLFFVIVFICALQINFLWLFGYSPTYVDITKPNQRIGSELYTSDGKLIGRYYNENRSPITYQEIAPSVIQALVATEDVRFYQHHGIDFRSLVSSGLSTAKGDKRGASTITQQLAKNLYRTRYNKSQGLFKHIPVLRTMVSKIKEWITALKLESNYSKNEILTLYLNAVPFGNNTFGIKTAARVFFDKEAHKLTVAESALLVGVLNATTAYNPIKNPEKALERRNIVLGRMQKKKFITLEEFEEYKALPLKLKLGKNNESNEGDSYLRAAVARYLEKWCEDNNYDLYEDGLKIYTTIDSRLQKYAEETVNEKMENLQKRFYYVWGNEDPWQDSEKNKVDYPNRAVKNTSIYKFLEKKYENQPDSIQKYLNKKKKMTVFTWKGEKDTLFSTMDSIRYYGKILNTGMMTMDPFNGKIKVWVGGINHKFFKYDHVNQSKRQAGSTFKPFAYLAALQGGMSPCDTLIDKPVTITYQKDGKDEIWEPKNADHTYSYQPMSLRWAMGKSVNTITAQITERIGWDNVVHWAQECGISSHLESVPSVALGSNDVSVFEMVRAYGTFLNKGQKTEPILVEKITDFDDNVIDTFKAKIKRAISEEIAWLMLYMFRGAVDEPGGTSQALFEWELFKKNNQIGGKTGTSSDYVDAWYMGITKDLVTGVWVGCDERTAHFKNGEQGEGSRTALPIFAAFMEKVYQDPNSGYTYGPFPKAGVEITRKINCQSRRIRIDTGTKDSTAVDSLSLEPQNENLEEVNKLDSNMTKSNAKERKQEPNKSTPQKDMLKNEENDPKKSN